MAAGRLTMRLLCGMLATLPGRPRNHKVGSSQQQMNNRPGEPNSTLAATSRPYLRGGGGDKKMATFVLVHGGWAGGWQMREVATRLRAAGHEVFTPTLTGLGERVHLASPDIDLETHIQDIVMVLEYEDLYDVILMGYSYSGLVVTAVAERVPDRLAQLVYLDAYVPRDGESLAALLGPETVGFLEQVAQAYGDGWRLPHDPPDAPRRTPQPIKPLYQVVSVANPAAARLPRTFIYCTQEKEAMGPVGAPITQAAARARADSRWRYRELDTGHIPYETAPQELAEILLELA